MRSLPTIIVIFLFISSCSKPIAPITDEIVETPGYPGVINEDATRTPIIIPTANITTGVVTGKLLSVAENEPLAYATIYLGEKLFLSNHEDYLVTLQEKSSPHAETDQTGVFVITDVPPNEYILILFSPRKSSPIIDPVSGKEVSIKVEPGKIMTLPLYNVSWP